MMTPYSRSVAPAQRVRYHCPPYLWLRPPATIWRPLEDMAVVSAPLLDSSPTLLSDIGGMCSNWCNTNNHVVDCTVGKTTLRIPPLCNFGSSMKSYKFAYCTRRNPELDSVAITVSSTTNTPLGCQYHIAIEVVVVLQGPLPRSESGSRAPRPYGHRYAFSKFQLQSR